MKRFSFIAALLLCFVTVVSAAIRPAQPGIGGGGGISGSVTGSYGFITPLVLSGTNVSLPLEIASLKTNIAYTNASMIFSNVLTLNPTSTTPRLNGMHLTNQAALARVGDTIDVQPGTYWGPTNVFSLLRNGVNWNFRPGAILIAGTTGDESDYNIPFNDWSGAVTSYIWGAGTFIVSNNLANFLNLTNSASRVIWHAKEIRAANEQAAIMQGHPNDLVGGGSKLWVYASDGIYADGYDAVINQHNPNSAQTFIYTSRLVGDTTAGDSAFETTVAYANPGDCVIRAGYARGDFTLTDNMDVELGALDLGANNVLYSPHAQSGNGILRNTYVYGTSNRTTALISTPSDSGNYSTHGTFVQCVFRGSTNRPIAQITNDNGNATTFISSKFLDGFGATNSIRSKNSQKVVLIGTDTPLGVHANIAASTFTNHVANRFKGLATFELGIDVFSDLNANGQLNAGDFTTTGTTIIGGPLEIPTGASSGYVLTSDGSGVATWAAPTGGSGGGGTNNPVLIEGPQVTLIANQTARSQHATNQSFNFSIIGSSNYSSRAQFFAQNTSSSIIYLSNLVTTFSVKDGSNVTAFAIPPTSTLELNLSLNASNQWVAIVNTKEYQLVPDGTTVTGTYDHAAGTYTLTATAASASTNLNSIGVTNTIRYGQTNIVVSDVTPVHLDLSRFNLFTVKLLTNGVLVFTNVYAGLMDGRVIIQQDTNGQRTVDWSVAGGLLQTNANLQPTTNANAVDMLEVMAGMFSTNLLAWWPQNFQPRVPFTNSLAGGTATLPLELVTTSAAGAYSVARKLTNAWTGALALVVRSSDSATNYLVPSGTGNNISAILSWAGTDSVYVTNLFDQSGNGRHLVQGNTNLCWVIATNGTAVSKSGITAMKRIGANAHLVALSVALNEPVSGIVTVYNESATASDIIVGGSGTTRQTVKQLSATAYRLNNTSNADIGTTTADQWDILTYKFLNTATDPDAIAVDGGTFVTGEAGSNASTSLNLGNETVGADVMIIDWIIWNADIDTGELGDVRDNINAYEAIY